MTSAPYACKTAVLLLVYRRPELTERVLNVIRQARPSHLLIAADGPHPERPQDPELCARTRTVIEHGVDWPCEMKQRYLLENAGCKRGVAGAIGWAFSQHERIVILEDDCLPHPSFFRYCDELLEKYAEDSRVMQVAGSNLLHHAPSNSASYFASRFGVIWGWATWRRAWALYDMEMTDWPSLRDSGALNRFCHLPGEAKRYTRLYDDVYSGRLDTWDAQWALTRQRNGALSLVPSVNLISNIGFGKGATHTLHDDRLVSNSTLREIELPLTHPTSIEPDNEADRRFFARCHREFGWLQRIARRLGLWSTRFFPG